MQTKLAVVIITFAVAWRWMSPRTPLPKTHLQKEYDYVIVGAGSAGAILAARLSEDPDVTVALLEAGPDNAEFPDADVPLAFLELQQSDINWGYFTESQQHSCHGLQRERSPWPRGRSLGGTSMINAMMAVRGSRHDYDKWAKMGNTGWSYEDVLPYFKKIETFTNDVYKTGYRGNNGPVVVTDRHTFPESTSIFLEAAESQGFKIGDINGLDNTNVMMPYHANIGNNGVRQSTAITYLKPAMSRDNLHVLTEAHASKVLFKGKQAIGMEYLHRGIVRRVQARKEVILSAGAIGSPQILMLSGVGPRKHLEDLKIPLVADLPVGDNLKDHLFSDTVVYTLEKPVALLPERIGLMDLMEYKIFGTGTFSEIGLIASGFERSKHQPDYDDSPFIQHIVWNTLITDELAIKDFNFKPEVHKALYGGLEGRDGMTIFPALLQPASVGHIRLHSANPFDHPIIEPRYLTEKRDVDVLIDGVRKGQRIMESAIMVENLGAERITNIHPNCANQTYDSDEYWECYVRSNTFTIYHATSTCRMGPDSEPNAVVDPKLRVRGLKGLRVVDASIMPEIPSGNTNFPVMMIAERAADIIKSNE